MRIETDLDGKTVGAIARHYNHAKEKHPYFCDELTRFDEFYWLTKEYDDKKELAKRVDVKNVGADDVLASEVAELFHAVANGDTAAAVEECYDTIAVLLRAIDVLEGRQALGKPGAKEGADKGVVV